MKKTIAFLMSSFLFLTLKAQPTELTGALGLNFGCSKAAAKEMMRTKYIDAKIYKESDKQVIYEGGKWAGRNAAGWIFSFTNDNKLHTIAILLEPTKESDIFDFYEGICSDMIAKYGQPESIIENWKYPYTAEDKYKHGITAIKVGKSYISHFWQYAVGDASVEEDDNSIQVKITDSVWVKITYQNGILIQQSLQEDSQKNQGDM